MRPSITLIIVSAFIVTGFWCNASSAQQSGSNRFNSMAKSMFDMMDAFSSEYQKRSGDGWRSGTSTGPVTGTAPMGGFGSIPWSGGMNPWSGGMNPWSGMTPWNQGYMPWIQQGMDPSRYLSGHAPSSGWWPGSPSVTAALDGNWRGRNGETLSINNGLFRIYQNDGGYREGRITLLDYGRLTMVNPETGFSRSYEYAEHDGKLALRSDSGHLLLFRRITSYP